MRTIKQIQDAQTKGEKITHAEEAILKQQQKINRARKEQRRIQTAAEAQLRKDRNHRLILMGTLLEKLIADNEELRGYVILQASNRLEKKDYDFIADALGDADQDQGQNMGGGLVKDEVEQVPVANNNFVVIPADEDL